MPSLTPPHSPPQETARFSCVVDSAPGMAYAAWIWAMSLTAFGGRDPSSMVVHLVDGCAPELRRLLEKLGVETVSVDRFDARNPPSNKLTQFASPALAFNGYRVLCDCDLAFCADVSAWACGPRIRAKIVDLARYDFEQWETILTAAGLRDRAEGGGGLEKNAVRTLDGGATIPTYCNGGLLFIPDQAFEKLSEAWPRWDRWVLDRRRLLGDVTYHVNQVSFALACLDADLQIDYLPDGLNVPMHLPRYLTRLEALDPYVLHFHNQLNAQGKLKLTGVEAVDSRIAHVNELIEERQQTEFDRSLLRGVGMSMSSKVTNRIRAKARRLRAELSR